MRCTEECPFGAINEDKRAILAQPTRCRRCSVCLGACPESIISFKNYSWADRRIIKSINVPMKRRKAAHLGSFLRKRRYPALDMIGLAR